MSKSAFSPTILWAPVYSVLLFCFCLFGFFFFSSRKTIPYRQLAIPEGMQPFQKSYSLCWQASPLLILSTADKLFNPSHKFANRKEEQRESSDRPLGLKRIDSIMCHSPAVSGHLKLQGFIFNVYVLSSPVGSFNFSSVWRWLCRELMKIKNSQQLLLGTTKKVDFKIHHGCSTELSHINKLEHPL